MGDDQKPLDYLNIAAEVYANVREDRKRMVALITILEKVSETNPELAGAGASEVIARLQDCMTKSNAQLIELLRLNTKKNGAGEGAADSVGREGVLDEIARGGRADA